MNVRVRAPMACLVLLLVAAAPVASSAPTRAVAPGAPEPGVVEVTGVEVVDDVEIPTRSGNVLLADVYRPLVGGERLVDLPTVVIYTPYVKDDPTRYEVAALHRFAEAGYAGVLVDIPGTGVSNGEFGFLDDREIQDGVDAVEWAAAQDFSSGRVGMWGYSYPGITAARVAAEQPPHLEAIVPASVFHDPYRDVTFPGGMLTSQDGLLLPFITGYTYARQRQGTDYQRGLEAGVDSLATPGGTLTLFEAPTHPTYDDYWRERALEHRAADIVVPTLLWSGWSDIYPRATLLLHRDLGAEHTRLVMGPWGHLAGATGEPLDLLLDESLVWFDTFLRQEPTAEQAAAVAGGARVFDNDPTSGEALYGVWPGTFTDLEQWPAPDATTLTYALCAGAATPTPATPWPLQGTLADGCEESGDVAVLPLPVDATGGGSIGHDGWADARLHPVYDDKDQRLSTTSTAFVGAPLEDSLLVSGPIEVSLRAVTTGVDTDWVVRLVAIGPDGATSLSSGWLRASHRAVDPERDYLWHPHDAPQQVTPGEPYDLRIEVWPTSQRVPAGHRLGVLVRTADTLKTSPGAVAPSLVQTGPDVPSQLRLSVRPAPGAGA